LAWDVGSGFGQSAQALTAYFDHIHATDLSSEQIEAAPAHPQITYLTWIDMGRKRFSSLFP